MSPTDTLPDPGRTIEAGRLLGFVHVVAKVYRIRKRWRSKYRTLCGLDISHGDLLISPQRPEDITCLRCKELINDKKM